jgi:hypothetical protein
MTTNILTECNPLKCIICGSDCKNPACLLSDKPKCHGDMCYNDLVACEHAFCDQVKHIVAKHNLKKCDGRFSLVHENMNECITCCDTCSCELDDHLSTQKRLDGSLKYECGCKITCDDCGNCFECCISKQH